MSNTISIHPTKFVNMADNTFCYGFRVSDSYASQWIELGENELKDDEAFKARFPDARAMLKHVNEMADETIGNIFGSAIESGNPLFINGRHYEYEEMKDIIEGETEEEVE